MLILNKDIKKSTNTEGLLDLHIFTDVDSTIAFVGKEKTKLFNLF